MTPVLNANRFIEHTLQSVIAQGANVLEHIVVDGGSTDGTLDILARFRDRVRLIEGPDRGQADAVNRGIAASSGDLVVVVNADDVLYPGSAALALAAFAADPTVGVVYGDADHIDADGAIVSPYPAGAYDADRLSRECFICQPAAFVRRDVLDAVGGFRVERHFALDYDLWLRIAKSYCMQYIPRPLAGSRMHTANKSLSQRAAVYRDIFATLHENLGYVPYQWCYGFADYVIDRKDQFLERTKPTPVKVLLSLAIALWQNPGAMPRASADWWSHRSASYRAR